MLLLNTIFHNSLLEGLRTKLSVIIRHPAGRPQTQRLHYGQCNTPSLLQLQLDLMLS